MENRYLYILILLGLILPLAKYLKKYELFNGKIKKIDGEPLGKTSGYDVPKYKFVKVIKYFIFFIFIIFILVFWYMILKY